MINVAKNVTVTHVTVNVRPANSGDIYYLQDYNICIDWHCLLKDTNYQVYVLSPMFRQGLIGYSISQIKHAYIVEEIFTKSPKLIDFLIGQATLYGKRIIFKVHPDHVYTQEVLKSKGLTAFKEIPDKILIGQI